MRSELEVKGRAAGPRVLTRLQLVVVVVARLCSRSAAAETHEAAAAETEKQKRRLLAGLPRTPWILSLNSRVAQLLKPIETLEFQVL